MPSKNGFSASPSSVGLFIQALLTFKAKCSRGSSPQCQTLRLSWRAIFLWKHPFVVCVGFMLFGTRAIFSIDVCHLFPQCVLAIIPLIGGVTDLVTRVLHTERGLFFALWVSPPYQRQDLLPSCWNRSPQICFLAVFLI